jgi:hypothetical protein
MRCLAGAPCAGPQTCSSGCSPPTSATGSTWRAQVAAAADRRPIDDEGDVA